MPSSDAGSNLAWVFIFFGTLLLVDASNTQNEDTSLIQLHVIWRHGNRTRVPLDTYTTDPYKNIPDPEGVGNLNKRGKLRAHQLGTTLRERYHEFLGDEYLPQVHLVRSTQKSRALDSALLVMSGLFPPKPQGGRGTPSQPSDLITEPLRGDNLLGNIHIDCPAMADELKRVKTSADVQKDEQRISENGTVFEFVSNKTGDVINDSIMAQGVHNALLCEEDQGWVLPEWTKTVYPEPLRSLAGLGLGQFGRTRLLQRLLVGPLLELIISSSEKASISREAGAPPKQPTFYAYSGHDNNLVGLLAAFNLTQLANTVPKYSAHMAFEIRRGNASNATYARILFEGEELLLEGCGFQPLCPFQRFRDAVADLLVTREQHWKECKPQPAK